MSDERLAELGTRIRALRRQKGMTQRELAEVVGIDFTYLSKIENARMPEPPSEKTVRTIEGCIAGREDVGTLQDIRAQWIAARMSDRVLKAAADRWAARHRGEAHADL